MTDKSPIPATFSTERVINITRAIAGRVGYQAVIDAMSEEIQEILPHNHFDVVILDEAKENLVAYETGIQTAWGGINRKNVSTSPIRDILLGKVDYLITANAMEDLRFNNESMFNAPIFEHTLRSRLHVQVRVAGELIGALSISSTRPDLYSLEHIENAKLLSDLIGPYFFALWQSELVRVSEIAVSRKPPDWKDCDLERAMLPMSWSERGRRSAWICMIKPWQTSRALCAGSARWKSWMVRI